MNQNITYEQLLELSIEEFNNRKNKTIQELLLYLYHYNKKFGLKGYIMRTKEIYRAFIDSDEIIDSIYQASDELLLAAECEDCKEAILGFMNEFSEDIWEIDKNNPLVHWSKPEETINAFMESLSFFFGVFDWLEDWDYDLSELMTPPEYTEDEE